MYLVLYPFVRFWLEYLRPDAWMVGEGLATAQLVSLICIAVAGAALFLRHRRPRQERRRQAKLLDKCYQLLFAKNL